MNKHVMEIGDEFSFLAVDEQNISMKKADCIGFRYIKTWNSTNSYALYTDESEVERAVESFNCFRDRVDLTNNLSLPTSERCPEIEVPQTETFTKFHAGNTVFFIYQSQALFGEIKEILIEEYEAAEFVRYYIEGFGYVEQDAVHDSMRTLFLKTPVFYAGAHKHALRIETGARQTANFKKWSSNKI